MKESQYQNYAVSDTKFFSQMKPEDENIKPVPENAHYEWTETSMFGFNIPDHDIDCILYFWHHPVMRITYGGIMIWRGDNINQIQCDYSDYRMAMPMPEDQTDCTYANGIRVKMIKPMEEFQISMADEDRNTHLDLHLKAIMPPACRHNGGHITQAMKTSGTLVLNGEKFVIDGYHSRDRSWNEARNEMPMAIAPLSWSVGIVDESFAFHHLSLDDVKYHPEWEGKLQYPSAQNTLWGYVWEDGELYGVESVDQHTIVDPATLMPRKVESVLKASNGKSYEILGTAGATTQIQCWPNMSGHFALMKWEIDGKRIAYGDLQRCIWTDAWKLMIKS